MKPFTTLKAIAAPFEQPNIDTNQLCPTRFNKVPRGPKYARVLFHDLRFNADGSDKEFILNAEPYNKAGVIVADRNFGCGSSRESAVYALYEFGIRCIIAPSFGDIFANNCSKNGLLAVTLSLLLAPLLFAAQDRLLDPWLERRDEPEYDAIDAPANPVIIAGYGRIGQIISRVLRMCGVSFTAIEASYQQVDFVRRYGASVYYGAASQIGRAHV